MRIVSRKDFMSMPDGTVFMKFAKQPKSDKCKHLYTEGSLSIKVATCGNDFVVQDTIPEFCGADDSLEWSKVMESMLDGKESPPVDYYGSSRDAMYDDDELFMVWNSDDLTKLIDRLVEAKEVGYK